MKKPNKPTCLEDLRALVDELVSTGSPAVVNLPLVNRNDAILRILAYLGICWGRDEAMLESILGEHAELVEPAEDVKFAARQQDGSFVFVDKFDQLKSNAYYMLSS